MYTFLNDKIHYIFKSDKTISSTFMSLDYWLIKEKKMMIDNIFRVCLAVFYTKKFWMEYRFFESVFKIIIYQIFI